MKRGKEEASDSEEEDDDDESSSDEEPTVSSRDPWTEEEDQLVRKLASNWLGCVLAFEFFSCWWWLTVAWLCLLFALVFGS